MRAQRTRRTLLSLVFSLLFLKPVAMGSCSSDDQKLLQQLQHQAEVLQDPSTLLDPYIHMQGLDVSRLKESCQERPGDFPSKNALHKLSRRGFLQTLNTTLGHVFHRLATLEQDLSESTVWRMAKMYISGVRNNIYCIDQLLGGSLEIAEPPEAGPGALPLPTLASSTFQRKLEGCQILRGYHRFMQSVGQVFRRWRESPSRSRRHSPHRALRKGARRRQPSMRGWRLVPQRQLPR